MPRQVSCGPREQVEAHLSPAAREHLRECCRALRIPFASWYDVPALRSHFALQAALLIVAELEADGWTNRDAVDAATARVGMVEDTLHSARARARRSLLSAA